MPEAHMPCNPFSDGELAFFTRFIREPSVIRNGMLKNTVDRWGFCARHTLGLLAVSASVPRAGLHTTAALHQRIVEQASSALQRCAAIGEGFGEALRGNEPCPMCELGLNERSTGLIRREWLTMPHSLKRLRSLLDDTRDQWSAFVCGTCVNSATGPLCRGHAVIAFQTDDETTVLHTLDQQRDLLDTLNLRLERFLQTFSPDKEGVDAGEGVAALIAAAGWCAGWQTLSQAIVPSLAGESQES